MLLGRCASRFAVAETEAKVKVDLPAEAEKLLAAEAAVRAVGPKLSREITAEHTAAVRAARVAFERVVDALAPEPRHNCLPYWSCGSSFRPTIGG